MANCNCNDFPISCAPHAPGGDCCHPHGCPPHPHPCPPFKGGTSMYIGARYVPIFADPVEWDNEREYEPLTIVVHNGDCYTSKCYVPKGAQLPPYPEGQTKYWVKTSDYNYQFADLKKTVTDLSRLVEQFQKDNERFTELINGWNEKVIQWEKDMAAWGERLDAVESDVADLTASLNAEIDRAKAAEQANAAAIAQETADRKQAISELDTAYKAADAAEAQARAEADTALGNRITANQTDIDAIKAEQVIQNTNITNNAKNISDNAAEIAKHAARLTDLESNASDWDDVFPDTTIAQEVKKEENTRANAVTELKAKDTQLAADIEEVRDLTNHKVDQTVFQAADTLNAKYSSPAHTFLDMPSLLSAVPESYITRENMNNARAVTNFPAVQPNNYFFCFPMSALALKSEVDTAQTAADKANANIGDWETDHPSQTISQCATSHETELEEHAGDIARLETDKADKSEIPDVSGLLPKAEAAETYQPKGEYALKSEIPNVSNFVTTSVYNEGQQAQDAKIDANTAALADKADKSEIPDVSGLLPKTEAAETYQPKGEYALKSEIPNVSNFVTTSVYNEGQQAQDAKIDANTAALADKADKSEIPDVSGFVTTQTYEEGQAAQDYKTKIPETGVRMQTAGVYWNRDGALEMTMPLWVIPSNWDISWSSQPRLTNSVPTSGTIELFDPQTSAIKNVDYSNILAQFDAINGCIRFILFCLTSNLPAAVFVLGIKTTEGNIATYYPYNLLTYV